MNKNYQLLINPFSRIAGIKSLLLGLSIMLITSFFAFLSYTRFDGVLDSHLGEHEPFYLYLVDAFLVWFSIVVIFYPVSIIVTKFRSRFIDVAGTFLLARFPLILDTFLTFMIKRNEVIKFLDSLVNHTKIEYTLTTMDLILFIISVLFSILVTVWYIALTYKAFVVNTNLKGAKSAWIFVVCILIAEVLSKVLFHYLNIYI